MMTMMISGVVQRSGQGMPAEEEGLRPVSGKPGRRPGKPEQDADRRTEISERTLLPEGRTHLGPHHRCHDQRSTIQTAHSVDELSLNSVTDACVVYIICLCRSCEVFFISGNELCVFFPTT